MFESSAILILLGILGVIILMFVVAGTVYFVGKKKRAAQARTSLVEHGGDQSDFSKKLLEKYNRGE